MKVALVVDGLQIGGIERVCVDYSKILLSLGYDISLVNLDPKKNEMVKELPSEIKIINWKYPREYSSERYSKLIKYGKYGKYVYPIVATAMDVVTFINKLFFRFKNRTNYDLVIAFSSHFNDLTFVANSFIKTRRKLAWMHGALYSYLLISDGYYNLYNKIKNLICLVDDAQEEVMILNKNTSLKINKLYNPTFIAQKEIHEDRVKQLRSKYGKFLLMVARFDYPHKDHYTVIDAFAKSKKTHKDITLVLIGSGPNEQNVKEYVVKSYPELREDIKFLGARDDVENYYRAAYMLLHASVAGEGLPTVQLEALAYGLPQVVTDSKVGPREILGNNEYGLLSKVRDSDDMSEKINKLLENDELYRHFQKVSKERIIDFSPKVITKKLKYILDDIME